MLGEMNNPVAIVMRAPPSRSEWVRLLDDLIPGSGHTTVIVGRTWAIALSGPQFVGAAGYGIAQSVARLTRGQVLSVER